VSKTLFKLPQRSCEAPQNYDSDRRDETSPAALIEQSLSLVELASAINCEHQLCQEAYKASLLHARRTGEFLLQAKSQVKSSTTGRWLPWLLANCPDIPERTARAYMEVAREWERIEKSATVADFGFKDALKLLSENRASKKSAVRSAESPAESTDVIDAQWTQTQSSSEPLLSNTASVLKERDRVVVTDAHPLFAGQRGIITGRPSPDAAIVALNEGERERILVKYLLLEELKPLNLVDESTLKEQQLLASIQYDSDVPPSETCPPQVRSVNAATLTNGQADMVATEIAIGIKYLEPDGLLLVMQAIARHIGTEALGELLIKSISKEDVTALCNMCLGSISQSSFVDDYHNPLGSKS